jgi:hypothetical protein
MKKSVLCLLIIMAAVVAFADDGPAIGGSGGPDVAVTQLGGSFGVLSGGSGRATFAHTVSIGGGGYLLALPLNGVAGDGGERIRIAYGGFIVGLETPAIGLFRAGAEILLGGGTAILGAGSDPTHSFYVVEPEAHVFIDLLPWMRLTVGAGYRIVLGLDGDTGLSTNDLSGMVVPIGLRFGSF